MILAVPRFFHLHFQRDTQQYRLMVNYDPKNWLRVIFSYRGTVLSRMLDRVLILAGLTLLVWICHRFVIEIPPVDNLGHQVMGVAVGLLIVFRNNTSYDRYWEGRKMWGAIVNDSRNLVRGASAFVGEANELARLVSAYALALKQHLRSITDLSEIQPLVSGPLYARASAAANPPSIIAHAMSAWIHDRLSEGKIDAITARTLEGYVAGFLNYQGACERILKTPIPFAYAVHIKQLLMLFLVTLPLVLVPKMGWSAILTVPAITFGLLGIEEAGVEIEDPFGDDPNDLPLEAICATIARDTTALAELPSK